MINAGTMSAQLAIRARDPNFNGTTQAQVISLLSYSQQVVNGSLSNGHDSSLGDITGSAPLVLQPRTPIYSVSGFVPGGVKILAIRDNSGRDLEPMTEFVQLIQTDLKWVTRTADAPRGWCYAGRDVLIVYPAVLSPQTVTVVYSLLTPTLATTADTTVVPNETDDVVFDLAEALLLLKGRDLNGVATVVARFSKRMGELANVSR